MSDESTETIVPSIDSPNDARAKVFPLTTPRGAGPLIGWASAARPVADSTGRDVAADGGFRLARANGSLFDGQESGFFGAVSGKAIRLYSEGGLVVGREAVGDDSGSADPDGPVVLALGLDLENRIALGYYERIRHPDTSNSRDMAGRLVRLVSIVPSRDPVVEPPAVSTGPAGVADVIASPIGGVAPVAAVDRVAPAPVRGADAQLTAATDRAAAVAGNDAGAAIDGHPRSAQALVRAEGRGGLAEMFMRSAGRALPAGNGMLGSINRHLRIAVAAMVLLVGGVGGWAATTELSGAVIAMGQLVVNSNVKKVQHQLGGVVAALNVRDGDHVAADEVLIRLDGTQTRANLAIVVKALDELHARQARGIALRDGEDAISFPPELLARRSDPEVAALLEGEERLFKTMLAATNGQKAQFREQMAQLDEQVRGMEKQLQAKEKEIDWNGRELVGIRELWEKNLVDFARVTSAERDGARLEGEQGFLLSSIAEAKGKIAEIELRILQVDEDLRTEMGKELADIRSRIAELVEKKTAAEDELRRLDIRAPQAGVVHELALHTVGGVIRPGDTIMGIVPDSDNLTAEVKVPPQEIDQLYSGQAAVLRFLTFNQQTTPVLNARIEVVSADVTTDQKTGAMYYTVRVSVPKQEIVRLEGAKLIAGMPVEVFVQTNPRTVMSYMIKPLSDQVERAFRGR